MKTKEIGRELVVLIFFIIWFLFVNIVIPFVFNKPINNKQHQQEIQDIQIQYFELGRDFANVSWLHKLGIISDEEFDSLNVGNSSYDEVKEILDDLLSGHENECFKWTISN